MIEGLSHSVNLGLDFLQQTSAHISCDRSQVKLCFGEGKRERYTRLVTANQTPFPFKGRGKREKQGEEFSRVLGMVWRRKTRPPLVPQNENRAVNVVYNVEKTSIPPGHGRFVRVCTGREGIGNQISTVTADLPEDRICRRRRGQNC